MDESINPVSGSGDGVLLLTDGRLLVALDDFINPKTGRKIFGCAHFFDHAAKANQSKYPWAQNVVLVGLLKRIKGRWACLREKDGYRFTACNPCTTW